MANNKNLLTLAALSALTLTLSACAFKKDDGSEKPPAPVTADTVVDRLKEQRAQEAADGILTKENVKVEFTENEIPGSYQLHVSWPSQIRYVNIVLNEKETFVANNVASASIPVVSDKTFNLSVKAYGTLGGGELSNLPIVVRSPKDTIIDGEVALLRAQTIVANRVFFKKGGQVITNGYPFSIEAKTLVFEDDKSQIETGTPFVKVAHVMTFRPSTTMTEPRQLHPAEIVISATQARGNFRIGMIGVNGLAGKSGAEIEKEKGFSRVAPQSRPEDQGLAGLEKLQGTKCGSLKSELSGCGQVPGCVRQPQPGKKGPKGATGVKGGDGTLGGDAGALQFNIGDASQLTIELRQKVGTGGAAGTGGSGFPGTLGGKPGAQPDTCSAAADGDQGDLGDVGEPGAAGLNGKTVIIPNTSGIRVNSRDLE